MLLEKQELELLKLCAITRYLPCDLAGKYDLEIMNEEIIKLLIRNKCIKVTDGERKCYRLTGQGRDILTKAGFVFPKDVRAHKQGNIFNRRVIGAELDVILHCAGINIYAEAVQGLSKEDYTYIPSLTMRADGRNKSLAGTRFYGILRIKDTAYMFYQTDKADDGVFPMYEEMTFLNLIASIDGIRHIRIVIVSNTVEGLAGYLMLNEKPRMSGGMISFSELAERWKYEFYLLPRNTDGITQMKLMCMDNYKKDIAGLFGDTDNVPARLSRFDAVCGGKAYITAMDMNVSRVKQALEQTLTVNVIPNIICLPYQRSTYQKMAVYYEYPKQMKFTVIHNDKINELFSSVLPDKKYIQAARSRDGEYVKL